MKRKTFYIFMILLLLVMLVTSCVGAFNGDEPMISQTYMKEKVMDPMTLDEKRPIAEKFLRQFYYYLGVSKTKEYAQRDSENSFYNNVDLAYTGYMVNDAYNGLVGVYSDCLSAEELEDVKRKYAEQGFTSYYIDNDSKIFSVFTNTGLHIIVYSLDTSGGNISEAMFLKNVIASFDSDHEQLFTDITYAEDGTYTTERYGREIYVEDLTKKRKQHTVYLTIKESEGNERIWSLDLEDEIVLDFYKNHDRTTSNVMDDKSWHLFFNNYDEKESEIMKEERKYLPYLRLYVDGELIEDY